MQEPDGRKRPLRIGALRIGDHCLQSRLWLGTARYPSLEILSAAIREAEVEIVTVSLRRELGDRELPGQHQGHFWESLREMKLTILPNTAGCRTAKEAITTARMARDLFETTWIKLEVIGEEATLRPDPFGLVEAARVLSEEGFEVFPYTTTDPVVAERLLRVGCRVLMPWGAPIGTGQGLTNIEELQTLRALFPEVPLIVDAGLGKPSHAAAAMELGCDAVLLNTAVAMADDPVKMARAFATAVRAGREGFEAGMITPRRNAINSTPVVGTPFWHMDGKPPT